MAKRSLIVRTGLKSGGISLNHNEKLVCGLRVSTHVKAGAGRKSLGDNHNETLVHVR